MNDSTEKSHLGKSEKLLFLFFASALFLSVLPIMPYGDDVSYLTGPTCYAEFPSLMPSSGHWRPVDKLYGAFIYYIPWAYPFLNHLLVMLGHVSSALVLILLARRFKVSWTMAFCAGIMFLTHANAFATFSSIDSINQSLSLAFGSMSILAYLDRKFALYVLLAFFSVCSKESGFLFFIIPPVLRIAGESEGASVFSKKFIIFSIKTLLPGFFLTLVYFSFTFGVSYFSPFVAEGVGGAIRKPDIYNPIFGSVALLGRISTVDLPAILMPEGKNTLLFAGTFIMGLPVLLAVFAFCALKIFRNLYVLALCGIIFILALSHAAVAALTEMNSYPVIFFSMLLAGSALDYFAEKFGKKKILVFAVAPFLVASAIVLIHKFHLIYETNKMGLDVVNNIEQATAGKSKPNRVFVMLIDNAHFGHDIYQLYPSIASGYGEIMKQAWNNWDMDITYASYRINVPLEELVVPKYAKLVELPKNEAEEIIEKISNEKIKDFDAVWILRQNGEVAVKTK